MLFIFTMLSFRDIKNKIGVFSVGQGAVSVVVTVSFQGAGEMFQRWYLYLAEDQSLFLLPRIGGL